MEIFQKRILKWVTMPFSRAILPTYGSNLGLCITDGFFTAEPPGKPRRVWGSKKMKRKKRKGGKRGEERERRKTRRKKRMEKKEE